MLKLQFQLYQYPWIAPNKHHLTVMYKTLWVNHNHHHHHHHHQYQWHAKVTPHIIHLQTVVFIWEYWLPNQLLAFASLVVGEKNKHIPLK